MILNELLHGGNRRESSSNACTDNSHGHSLTQEGNCTNIRDSEANLHEMTHDDHLITKYNMFTEDGKRDPHAIANKGNLDMVEILLERDANAKNPYATGWTQNALVGQLKGKGISDQIMSCEKEKKPDEYRIEAVEPEILNLDRNDSTRNRRQDGFRSINFPSEKVCTNSFSRNSNCQSDRGLARFIKKRVTIHLQSGCRSTSQGQHGKLIILPDSLEELLKIAGKL